MENPSVERVSPIHSTVTEIYNKAIAIRDRLDPILSPETPQTPTTEDASPPTAKVLDKLYSIARILDDVYDRLGV